MQALVSTAMHSIWPRGLPLYSCSKLSPRCCHYSRDETNYRGAIATAVVMKPPTQALLPLQPLWSQLPLRCCHYIRDETNYRGANATAVVMKPPTQALLPLQSLWSQLTPRCCHYSRDETNYRGAIATTVVMKPPTQALLPLQSLWSQLPLRCCHYSRHEANYQNSCRQNYRDTTAHRYYRPHCNNSMFIATSFIRLRSLHFLLHSSVLAVPWGASHCVTAGSYNL